ncbi:hypothetical protein MTsPCn5_38230 [Croceitalea sp. MTPC5]|nr:hypothetical protein MTsPCn5_38230 [Croceitalea sp. MTPC5]
MKDLFVSLYSVLKEIIVTVGKELWSFIKQKFS